MPRFNLVMSTVWMLVLAFAGVASAGFIDPLDTAANFDSGFGGTTAVANGDGTVTLTRNVASVDAGIDWMIGGSTKLPLDWEHHRLELLPVTPVNNGFYSVSILYFNGGGGFLGEPNWISDSQDTTLQVLPDVGKFALDNGINGAASWFVRFRIQPFPQAGAAFTFTNIQAIPEPAMVGVISLGGLTLLRRRR